MENKKCRKGSLQIQFAWIFIVIAGSVILFFFISLVTTQKNVSDNRLAEKVLSNFDAIMTGSKVSTNTCHLIDIPKLDVNLDCRSIRMAGRERQLQTQMVFGPDEVRGNELITCAKDWNTPYRITNFLYLTTTETRYVIIYQNTTNYDDGERLFDNLPENLNKDLIPTDNISSFANKNNYKIRIVCFNSECDGITFPTFLESYDSSLLKIQYTITSSDSDYSYGNLDYYKIISGGGWEHNGTTYYLRDASVYGAVFANDIDQFNCVMGKGFERLTLVTEIYLNRTSNLFEHYKMNHNCRNHYDETNTQSLIDAIHGNSITGLSSTSVSVIHNSAVAIKNQNEYAQLYSCPVIY